MSLRELGKQERRGKILAAAETLVRENGGVGFSMRELAKRAGVAFVTPFNLFGNKGGILAGLLEERLEAHRERLVPAHQGDDPVDRVFELALLGSRAYTSDPQLHRPLLRELPGAGREGDEHLLALATSLWRLALRDVEAAGMVQPGRNLDLLALTLHVHFRGALSLWAMGDLEAPELEDVLQFGVGACLASALAPEHAERVAARVRPLEERSSAGSHPPSGAGDVQDVG